MRYTVLVWSHHWQTAVARHVMGESRHDAADKALAEIEGGGALKVVAVYAGHLEEAE